MPFLDHLEELRIRLIKSIVVVLIFSIVALAFSDKIMNFLAKPVGQVYFMAPTEAFTMQIKISILVGVVAAAPFLIYQLWMFVLPGLYDQEVKIVLPVVLASTFFFYGGGAFCVFYVIPLAMRFLTQFGGQRLQPLISISEYYTFVTQMTLAFAVVFELPVIAYFLGRVGIISHKFLSRGRRYAIVIILVIAAILTPPDVFSQVALAVPLYALYELSILIVYLTGKKRRHPAPQKKDGESNTGNDPYAG